MENMKKREDSPKNKTSVKIRTKMRSWIAKAHRAWADWMSKKTQGLSRHVLYGALIVFVVASTTYNILVLKGHWAIKYAPMGKIRMPVDIGSKQRTGSAVSIDQGRRDLKTAKSYMDSLLSTKRGRSVLDSIKNVRPGLLDSLGKAEELLGKH